MTKFQKLKEAIKSPPPERLAKIEYQSHFMQMMGISAVCIFLFIKGFWYIIFAFVFGLGVSYSQGMTAYQRYNMIMSLTQPEKITDYEKDVSPSRRRGKIIQSVMGKVPRYVSIVLAVGGSVMFIDPTISRWLLIPAYVFSIIFGFIFLYFFIFYWICYPIYKRRVKKEAKQ